MSTPCVVVFATAWGPSHGGVNAFNTDLCIAFAKTGFRVVVVVLAADQNDSTEARRQGVELVSIGVSGSTFTTDTVLRCCELLRQLTDITLWTAHDIITGEVAIAVRLELRATAPILVIHHTSYRSFKAIEGADDAAEQKYREQQRVFSQATHVAAVGPKLLASATDIVRRYGDRAPVVFEVTPGLPTVPYVNAPHQFSLFFAGRLGGKSGKLKQRNLGLAAFGQAVSTHAAELGSDPILTILGADASADERRECRAIVQQYAKRHATVLDMPFTKDRGTMLATLSEQSAAMLLSVHEGFGLTGWESIGVGVPLIISRNSGAYELLARDHGGQATGCLRPVDVLASADDASNPVPTDVATVCDRIVEIARDPKSARRDARQLRSLLTNYTWENTANTIVSCVGIKRPSSKTSSPPQPQAQQLIPNTPQRPLIATALFDVYQTDCESHYIVRDIDHQVRPLTYSTHIWLHGPSGAGKTSMLRHALLAREGYHYVSLAGCVQQPLATMIEFVCLELAERLGAVAPSPIGQPIASIIRHIVQLIRQVSRPVIVQLDEVPAEGEQEHRAFCEILAGLLTVLASENLTNVPRVVISTIHPPTFGAGQTRIRERLQVVDVSLWDADDLRTLATHVANTFSLSLSESDIEKIVIAAEGSPRYVKVCMRKLVLYGARRSWPLERFLIEAKAEVSL